MSSAGARRLVAAVWGLGILALVAYLVAGSRDDASDAWIGVPDAALDVSRDLLLAAVLLLFVLIVVMIVAAVATREKGARFNPRDTSVRGIVVIAVVAFMVWFALNNLGGPEFEPGAVDEPGDSPLELDDVEPGSPPEEPRGYGGVLLWFTVMAGGVAVWGVYGWRRSQRAREAMPKTTREAERRGRRIVLAGLLDDAITRLREHPDPREATIAAWARLETALEAVGIPRLRSDTPSSYLRRVLEEVEASAAAVEGLTRAYERAMFSPHRVDRATQMESVDALVAVRDELRVLDRAGEAVRA